MKSIINKSTIFGTIFGILISSIGVYAYEVASSDVSYKSDKPEFTATNVGSALDTLYDRSINIADRVDGTYFNEKYVGAQLPNANTSLTLGKGDYYVLMHFICSGGTDVILSSSIDETEYGPLLFTHEGAECEIISNKLDNQTGTQKIYNQYFQVASMKYIYKCKVEESATFVATNTEENIPTSPFILYIDAIKLD